MCMVNCEQGQDSRRALQWRPAVLIEKERKETGRDGRNESGRKSGRQRKGGRYGGIEQIHGYINTNICVYKH